MKTLSPTRSTRSHLRQFSGLALLAGILILARPAQGQIVVSTWQSLGGGTFNWQDAANWNNGAPNSANVSANVNINIAAPTVINLNGNRTIGALVIGDNGAPVHGITINGGTVPGSILFLGDNGGTIKYEPALQKTNSGTDTLNVLLQLTSSIDANLTAGNLILAGGLNIAGGNEQTLEKRGGGLLTISGPLTIANTSGKDTNPAHSLFNSGGTINIIGNGNVLSKGIYAEGGVINIGNTAAGTFGTVFTAGQGRVTLNPIVNTNGTLVATTVNFGQNAATGVTDTTVINNITIDIDAIDNLGGTLNLRNGNNVGTTTLAAGATNTLTLNNGTTTFFTAGGTARGSVVVAPGAKLTMNNNAVLNFSSTANSSLTFASLNSASPTTLLRSQAGNATLTVGGDGIDDVFQGRIDLGGSGGNSRLIKIGTETLTLSGNRDNPTARLDVQGGTVVLAKESSALVHAIGSNLIIGDGLAGEKIVRIGGTFTSAGVGIPANFNDQIFRGSILTLNQNGVLDLNGFVESFDYMTGTGLITNRAAGTSATVIVGDNNFAGAARTFDGSIQDGAGNGRIGLTKTGNNTLSLTSGASSYTGATVAARGTTQLIGNGAFTGTESVRVERGAVLLLNNDNTTVQNRINNAAPLHLDRGTFILRGALAGNANKTISETLGDLTLNSFNVVRTDTTGNGGTAYVSGSSLTLGFSNYNRNPGGQVAIVEQSTDGSAGFIALNPLGSSSRVTLGNIPTGLFVGGGDTAFSPQTSILVGAFGGARGNASTELLTIQTVSGTHYVRPLRGSELNGGFTNLTVSATNLPTSLPATPASTWNHNVQLGASTAFRVNANLAFNAIVFNGTSNIYIAEDKKWILGGMNANANLGTMGFDGAGMLSFTTGAVSTFGGTMSFGSREAILRVGGSTHSFRSVIEGTAGLSKSGGTRLDLMGENTYTGGTWVNEGEVRGYTNTAFGIPGPGNEVMANIAAVGLQSGMIFGDGTPAGSSRLYLVGAGASLNSYDQNNVWGGDVYINATNAGGQSGQNVTMRAVGNSILTINGKVTGAGADAVRGLSENNPTQNFTGSGQGLILENNLSGTGGSIIYLNGAVSDREGQAAAGTGIPPIVGVPAVSAEHEKMNTFIRGFTGQAAVTNSDFVVNIKDATNLNGRIDLRSGLVFIDSNYGTGGRGNYVRGALIRLSDGGNVDRAGIMAGILMTQPGTTFRGSDVQIGVNDGSHSSNSMAIFGGLNRSGEVIIGSDQGTLDSNPVAGSSQFTMNSTAAASAGATTLNLTTPGSNPAVTANLRVGYGISGTGIVPGTTITAINGTIITLSQPTNAAAGSGTGYTVGFFPSASNVTATTTLAAPFAANNSVISLNSVTGFTVGRGISGPGIPAGSTIAEVDPVAKTVTLAYHNLLVGLTTGATDLTQTYSAYDVGNTITLTTRDGLRVGMGIVGTGIPTGATITNISGNTISLSAPLNNAMPLGTSLSFPLTRVAYQTINATTGGVNTSGGSVVQLFSVNGLALGTTVHGTGVQTGTIITAINPATNQVTLSKPLNANNPNASLSMMKAANFVESRLYAAPGGTVDFRMRLIDDGGFGLNNEMGAITKVGRGTVALSGSAAGASDMDGGVNLFGGTLIFDYINLQQSGEVDINLLRDNSRVSGGAGTSTAPYQFTMAGGKLLLRDGDAAGINESMRGTLTVRAGNSEIVGEAGNTSSLVLNLGYHNPYLATDSRYYWRAPDRFAGGTFQIGYSNLLPDPDDPNPVPLGGTVRVQYSQNAFIGGVDGRIGGDTVIPYATLKFNEPFLGEVVDFASFQADAQTNGLTNTLFADASGTIRVGNLFDVSGVGGNAVDVDQWDTALLGNQMLGYVADNYLGQQDFNGANGFRGVMSPNLGGDMRGVRVIRYTSNAQNNTINLGSSRLVLATSHPSDLSVPSGIVEDGGAILISNLVSIDTSILPGNPARVKPTNQFMVGGTLTSAMASTYFSEAVMPGPFTMQDKPAATSTDLIIHNYNEHGVFTIQSQMVNFQAGLPLNVVVSGPGVTKLAPTAGAGNLFTGALYINDGTVWVANTSALGGAASTSMIYLNGGTLEVADLLQASRGTAALARTLPSGRPIIIGGDGGTIKATAPGTVLTYSGVIRAEDNIIPINLSETQYKENMGVGDLIKTGAGRLVLTNAKAVNESGWNAYFGVTEILEGTLQLNIGTANSGILGSHYSHMDGTRIEAGGRLEVAITGATFGTSEWIDLLGGVLGTAQTHTDGALDGVIRFSNDSQIDVTQGNLRLNANAGTVEGSGKMIKTGAGTLMLMDNNANFSGDIEIRNGLVIGGSQGLPFGTGAGVTLGDNTVGASGTTGLLTRNRTTDGIFRSTYTVPQNIVVRNEGGLTQQTKVIGAINESGTGVQNDRHLFSGNISLLDDLIVRYQDEALNPRINPLTPNGGATSGNLFGGNRTITLAGNITGSRNLTTEVVQTGGSVNGADPDQIITFELGGDNSGWTGGIRTGNSVVDADLQHLIRPMNGLALGAANSVTLDFNSTLQVGGNTVNIGSLLVGLPVGSATTNGVYVENAANAPGTLVVNQTVNDTWDVIFRNGVTPVQYNAFDSLVRDNVLNLVKRGSGVVTMTQANSYTGFTHVGSANGAAGGTLALGTGGSISGNSALTVFGGVFLLNGVNQTLNEVVTLGGGASGTTAAIRTGSSTLTLNNNVAYNAANNPAGGEISGNVQMGVAPRTFTVENSIGAAIDLDVRATLLGSSAGALVKMGAGTMSLGGANTFTGGVNVMQGTLLATNATGSATGAGAVNVQPGATLGGVGTISGDVNLVGGVGPGQGATLAPGSPLISSGIELLNLQGTVTLGEYALVEFYLGQTGFTKLNVGTLGNVASTTKFRINLVDGYTPTPGATFDLLDWGFDANGLDSNWLDNLELPSGPSWVFGTFSTTGVISVSGTAQAVAFTSQPPATQQVNPGDVVQFTIGLTGTEPWLIQWKKNGVAIGGATGLTYTIPFALEADEANYSVEVSNGVNQIFSTYDYSLVVNDTPVILSGLTGGTVNPGTNFTFTVTAAGATDYEWRLNDAPIPGAPNASTYTITGVTEAQQGTYTVVVSNPAGSIASDPVILNVNDPVTFVTHPQNWAVPLGTPVSFSVNATGTAPLTYQWFRGATAVSGATGPTLNLTSSAGNLGSYTVRVTNVVGTVISNPGVLSEVAAPVSIITQPTPQMVAVGGTLTLNCQAVGALPLRYQWRRNGANVSGATSPTLVLTNVATSRAGRYTCFVSNTTGGGTTSETSLEVEVAVVNTAPRVLVLREGTNTTLSVTAVGSVNYQWFKDDGSGETQISGAVGSTLTLTNLMVSDKANYYCRVSLVGTGLTLDGGMNDLTVFNAAPDINMPGHFPATIVSEPYSFRIPLADGTTPGEPDPAKTPTKYVATGLPPGLKIDSQGWVTGRATAVRYGPDKITPVPYLVTVTASNSAGSDVVTNRELLVQELPGGVIGTFTGPVARNATLNPGPTGTAFGLGGRIDVTTTKKGTYTGKLLLGTKTYSFKGALNSNVASPNQSTVAATISRGKTLTPLTVNFTLDATNDLLTGGTVTDGTETATFNGWRNKWLKTKTLPLPAEAYQGYYTFGLDIPAVLSGTASNPGIPQGSGYGSFTVNGGTARLTVAGRLADGTAYSSATFVGPAGQVMVFRTLYAANARGSVLGQLNITTGPVNPGNTLAGTVNWWRPATPGTTARLYKDGFDPMDLTAAGSRYTPPVSPLIVMNIANVAAGVANANVTFVEANVAGALPMPSFLNVNVSSTHKVTAVSANNRKVTLSVNPRTGALSGRFTLSEAHPDAVNGGKPAVITRTVSYLGLIVRDSLGEQGVGYFLLPQLPPTKDVPNTKTPIFSGQMIFEKL